MDLLDSPYYRINKYFFIVTGQWPFHTARQRAFITFVLFLLAGTNYIAKIFAMLDSLDDLDMIFEEIGPIMANVSSVISLINASTKMKQMKELLRRVQEDFISYKNTDELQILTSYAYSGRKVIIAYAGFIYVALAFYTILPTMRILLGTYNSTSERPLIHHVKYFVNTDDYYYLIIFHSQVTVITCITIVFAVDAMFLTFIHHVCGLFATLGYQLSCVANDQSLESDIYPPLKHDQAYKRISKCVYRHTRVIEFVARMESYYSINTFLQAGINVGLMSIIGLQALANVNNTPQFVQYVLLSQGHLAHLFVQCLYAQRLIDHSEDVNIHLINVPWYQISIRTRHVIRMMLIRARTPCVLTGANIFSLSMEMFSTIMRTAMSFFTVLHTTQ